MKYIPVKIKNMRPEHELIVPEYATQGAAGVDLHAIMDQDLVLFPGQTSKVPTGIGIELPQPDVVALIFARSGLASKNGLTLVNGVGVIDSDYRGEIQVALINLGQEPFTIHTGDRIAQMIIMPVFLAKFLPVQELTESERGEEGFGSTGIHNSRNSKLE
ncbi:dUTP diphosphatase [Desulfitobacterium sp.]|uniref:dUTP diphosphatase n=1 Tax=Desulfitobacterium sp. TaxID=49981 RepID=UPI002C5BB957|nr:dUTP diphosphatase [Desulfitobacterium sp.]HVJ47750.1 dUTP diphosphatase [Desulfitobacterium sp.]